MNQSKEQDQQQQNQGDQSQKSESGQEQMQQQGGAQPANDPQDAKPQPTEEESAAQQDGKNDAE